MGIIHAPFTRKPQKEKKSEAESEIKCAWVVHNAGSFEHAGDRLAVLGKALDSHSIDLNIIRQGTNVLADVKLGALDQWVSVALALSRAQKLEAPALWATFGARSAVGMITPPQESNSAGAEHAMRKDIRLGDTPIQAALR